MSKWRRLQRVGLERLHSPTKRITCLFAIPVQTVGKGSSCPVTKNLGREGEGNGKKPGTWPGDNIFCQDSGYICWWFLRRSSPAKLRQCSWFQRHDHAHASATMKYPVHRWDWNDLRRGPTPWRTCREIPCLACGTSAISSGQLNPRKRPKLPRWWAVTEGLACSWYFLRTCGSRDDEISEARMMNLGVSCAGLTESSKDSCTTARLLKP